MSETFEFDTFLANGIAHILCAPMYIASAIGNAGTEVSYAIDGIKNSNNVQKEMNKKAGENAKKKEADKNTKTVSDAAEEVVEKINSTIEKINSDVAEVLTPEENKKVEAIMKDNNIVKPAEVVEALPMKQFSITGKEVVPDTKSPKEIKDIMNKWGFLYSINYGEGNLLSLEIYRNSNIDNYVIETGDLFGRGVNVLYFLPNNALLPINIKEDNDIAEKFLLNKDYPLSQEEINRCVSRMLPNYTLYRWFDMTGVNLAKLNQQNITKLSDKLTAVINTYTGDKDGNLPRFRFEKIKSVDEFRLVSDDKVNRPKVYIDNKLVSPTVNGDRITIKKDKIVITTPGEKQPKVYIVKTA